MIFDQTENSELFDLADRLGLYDGMRRFQSLEEKNMSTQDLIKNNYGESCLLFVKKALGLEGDR